MTTSPNGGSKQPSDVPRLYNSMTRRGRGANPVRQCRQCESSVPVIWASADRQQWAVFPASGQAVHREDWLIVGDSVGTVRDQLVDRIGHLHVALLGGVLVAQCRSG